MLSPRTQVLVAAVCFGTTGTAQALGPAGTTPLTVGAARIAIGGALLLLVARWTAADAPDAPRWSWRLVAVVGVAVAAYQVTFFAAVARTGVGVGTVVALGSAPAVAGCMERLSGGEPLGVRWAQATAVAVLGVALLVGAGGGDASIDPVGVLLALVAGAGYATYTVAAKRLMAVGHAPERVMAVGFGTAAVLLAPLLLLGSSGWLLTADGLLLAVYLGVVPTALAYVLFGRGLRVLSSGEVATLTLAEPLTAAALGMVVLGERPGAVAAVGAALVLAGLVLLARGARDEAVLAGG